MSISIAQPIPGDNWMADFYRTFRSAFFGGVPHDDVRRDQHEPATQPSLRRQQLASRHVHPDDAPAPEDSVLIDQVADVLARCIQAAHGLPIVAFPELPPAIRVRYRRAAMVAWRLVSREAAQLVSALLEEGQ